ncbi:unnamed protein product [Prorocentrum cordatum]|uniref:Fungal lipase-type domain-containing protein n=1 Tax=Prorocentrum cordatum TaxID=2364126 RepID=A0ABN9PX00_9DINO|nr:unnamed protein product [Polarella glacialis]
MPSWVAAGRSLRPLGPDEEHFRLEQQVERELHHQALAQSVSAAGQARGGAERPPGGGGVGGLGPAAGSGSASRAPQDPGASAPLTGAVTPPDEGSLWYGCYWCVCKLCALLSLLCFPFRPPSDHEDDDEEFAVETLARVRVHLGFTETYDSVRGEVLQLLEERLSNCRSEGRPAEIYVVGHSMGGAMASLFALDVVDVLAGEDRNALAATALSAPTPGEVLSRCFTGEVLVWTLCDVVQDFAGGPARSLWTNMR